MANKIYIEPEHLISEFARIKNKNFLTFSELIYLAKLLRDKSQQEHKRIIVNINQYTIERALRFYYQYFDTINDYIVINKIPANNLSDDARQYIHDILV